MIVTQKEAENKLNTRVYIYRYTNAENEMYEYNLNTWNHRNSERCTKNFRSQTRKTFNRFTTKDSYIWNILYNTESKAVWNLKPERWQ